MFVCNEAACCADKFVPASKANCPTLLLSTNNTEIRGWSLHSSPALWGWWVEVLSGLEDAQQAPSEGSLETFHSPKLAKIGNTSFLGPEDEPSPQSAQRLELLASNTVIASLRTFKNWL